MTEAWQPPEVLPDVLRAARPWLFFAAVALIPAATMAAVAVRATATEEASTEREATLALQASARRFGDAVESAERASLARLREARFEDADMAAKASLPRTLAGATPDFADGVALAPSGALLLPATVAREMSRVSEACAALARGFGELTGAAREQARTKLAGECAEARGPSGRWMYPLVALDASPVDAPALAAWLTSHATALRDGERAAVDREIAQSPFLDANARASLDAVARAGSARDSSLRALLDDGVARELAHAKVDGDGIARIATAASIGYVRLLADGRRVAFVTHAASLEGRVQPLGGRSDMRFALANPGDGATPLSAAVTLAPELRVLVTLRDPRDLTRRAAQRKAVLLAAGGLSASLALGLALYLFAQMRAARRLGELRTDFVAAVSHELRTPVASIRMLAELLEQKKVDDDEAPEVHATLAREARRLGDTVQRLLGFGAMARGKIAAAPKTEDVAAVVDDAVTEFEADHTSMPKVTRSLERPLEAVVDAALLRVALHNLLGNALKYAGDSAPFAVTLTSSNGAVVLSVRDHGPGIPARDQRRIFEPFERADDRLSRATEGSGIGLSLVRHIARAHGGDVRVESAPGAGATFILRVPKRLNVRG